MSDSTNTPETHKENQSGTTGIPFHVLSMNDVELTAYAAAAQFGNDEDRRIAKEAIAERNRRTGSNIPYPPPFLIGGDPQNKKPTIVNVPAPLVFQPSQLPSIPDTANDIPPSQLPSISDPTDKRIYDIVSKDLSLTDAEVGRLIGMSRQNVNGRRKGLENMGYTVRRAKG